MPTEAENKRQAARDVIDILEDISKILVSGPVCIERLEPDTRFGSWRALGVACLSNLLTR